MSEEQDISVPVLVDSKKIYTQILVKCLVHPIYQGIQQIYDQAKELTEEAKRTDYLKTFQQLLRDVPKWNQNMIDTEYNRVLLESKCNWLDNLIKAVILTHVRILSAVRVGSGHKTIKLNIPKANNFIHQCYIEAARMMFQNPYLFTHKAKEIDIHQNMKAALDLIKQAIEQAIQNVLPTQQILNEYLDEHPFEQPQEAGGHVVLPEEDIAQHISPHEMASVKEMVKADLKREIHNEQNDNEQNDNEEEITEEEMPQDDEYEMDEDEHEDEHIPYGKESDNRERKYPDEEMAVKNIKVRNSKRKHMPETEIHHRVRPENVGNVDLGNFKKKIKENRLTFFADAAENL